MKTKEDILKGMDRVLFDMYCFTDFKFFCERMLGLTDMGGIHDFQLEWIKIIEHGRTIIIEAPSGSSKSEIVGACYPLWELYKNKNKRMEIRIVSKTIAQSEKNLLIRIQNYILDNEILKEELVPSDKRTSWTKTGIRTINGSIADIVPYNINIKGSRAHIMILDEIDSYDDPEIFFKHVLSRTHADGKTIGISTPESVSNIVGRLKEKKGTNVKFHKTSIFIHKDGTNVTGDEIQTVDDFDRLRNNGCKTIWPENDKFNFNYMREDFAIMGRYSWVQNYLCEIIGESEDAAFPLKYIIESYDDTLKFSKEVKEGAMYFIGADFAISEGAHADYDAYVVVELYQGQYTIKHIEIHKGIDFPIKKERLKLLYDTYYSTYGTKVIADKSQMAISLINELRAMGITVIPQSFSGVARLLLLQTLSNVLQSKRLTIPKDSDDIYNSKLIDTLQSQLCGFKRTKTDRGNETYLSKAVHDDIAISLAMAIGEAVKHKTNKVTAVCR